MAASRFVRAFRVGVRNIRFLYNKAPVAQSVVTKVIIRTPGIVLCAQPVVSKATDVENVEPPDPSTLTTKELIKNAAVAAINSASTLLTQTVSSLMKEEEQYFEALERLIQLMEINLQVLGNVDREDKVWAAMLTVRSQVNECKLRRQELQDIFLCSEKMLLAASEAAYTAGAHYAASTAGERLHSAKTHLRPLQDRSLEAEHRLSVMEARSIEETMKYAEKATGATKTQDVQDAEEAAAAAAAAAETTSAINDNSERQPASVASEETLITDLWGEEERQSAKS